MSAGMASVPIDRCEQGGAASDTIRPLGMHAIQQANSHLAETGGRTARAGLKAVGERRPGRTVCAEVAR